MRIKIILDFLVAFVCLFLVSWLLFICIIIATIDTRSFGIFTQRRVGQHGKIFKIFKIKTMNDHTKKISAIGRFFRAYKIDEFPQLLNVVLGQMSIVGPRPDIEGYYDLLQGEDRKLLDVKPGITSEASLKYFNETELLSQQSNPKDYNDFVIFPDKVKINLEYQKNWSLWHDFKVIRNTLLGKHL